jgi:hypothetical protein
MEEAERMDARAERLHDRASRRYAQAQVRDEAGRHLADRIPLGQPILVDHYSAPRALADHQVWD